MCVNKEVKAVSSNKTENQGAATLSFEAAFARLEVILEKLNTGTVSLDDSLKLYEEADQLIALCNKRLTDAERKIEILVKNRTGELSMGNDDQPIVQEFKASHISTTTVS